MTPYRAPRLLLTGAMIVALACAGALWFGFQPHPLTAYRLVVIFWGAAGVSWAWLSAEAGARRRNRAGGKGEALPDDRKQFARLLLVSFLALLALGEAIILGQTFGVLGHDLSVLAPRATLIALGLVVAIWGDRRAKLVLPDNVSPTTSARRERWASWLMVLQGLALALSALFAPLWPVIIACAAMIIGLTAVQLVWRIRVF